MRSVSKEETSKTMDSGTGATWKFVDMRNMLVHMCVNTCVASRIIESGSGWFIPKDKAYVMNREEGGIHHHTGSERVRV